MAKLTFEEAKQRFMDEYKDGTLTSQGIVDK